MIALQTINLSDGARVDNSDLLTHAVSVNELHSSLDFQGQVCTSSLSPLFPATDSRQVSRMCGSWLLYVELSSCKETLLCRGLYCISSISAITYKLLFLWLALIMLCDIRLQWNYIRKMERTDLVQTADILLFFVELLNQSLYKTNRPLKLTMLR